MTCKRQCMTAITIVQSEFLWPFLTVKMSNDERREDMSYNLTTKVDIARSDITRWKLHATYR